MKPPGVRKGAWSGEEDVLLKRCIELHGEGNWHLVPQRAGLNRCRKSCRLRWLNYLQPNLNKEDFKDDEIDLIIKMHKLLGNRWSLIAGRIPGRTANDIKNFWNSRLSKRFAPKPNDSPRQPLKRNRDEVIRPLPTRSFNIKLPAQGLLVPNLEKPPLHQQHKEDQQEHSTRAPKEGKIKWWDELVFEDETDHSSQYICDTNGIAMDPGSVISDGSAFEWDDLLDWPMKH